MGDVVQPLAFWLSRLERTPDGLRVRSPADRFLERMHAARSEKRKTQIALRALKHDASCIPARLQVAKDEMNPFRIADLLFAVDCGERLWGSPLAQCVVRGAWSSTPEARPWLEAFKALGQALEIVRSVDDAARYYGRLLELDPDDTLEVRPLLAGLEAKRPVPAQVMGL
jgi:hypothetical protein